MTTPDTKTERWLESYGITRWDLSTIPIERIDQAASHTNQARLTGTAVDDEIATNYGLAMENGDIFPPIVLFDQGPKGYLVIDGNHRVAGKQLANETEIDAYILRDLTIPQRLLLTFDANTRHGFRTTTNERVQQAITLVNNGLTLRAAANALNVPEQRISQVLGGKNAERQLIEAGVDTSKLSTGHFQRLGAIRSYPVRAAAAKWFAEQRVNTTDASMLIKQINDRTSDADQLDFIRRESGRRNALNTATARGRVVLPAPIAHLQRALADIDQINANEITTTAVQERLTNDLKTVMASRALDASVKLRRLAEKLTN